MQYHQGQPTLPRLTALLHSGGVSISKREVQRLLTEKQQGFLDEARDVLRAGLETSPWVSVDDTGARHKAKNGFCTQIGNDRFTWFATRSSKTRLNFLDLLRAQAIRDESPGTYRLRFERGGVRLFTQPGTGGPLDRPPGRSEGNALH